MTIIVTLKDGEQKIFRYAEIRIETYEITVKSNKMVTIYTRDAVSHILIINPE
jgi:hypothetical protein